MRIVFRADASIQMGTGHVMRCLALADELKRQGHECSFICREHPGHMGKLIAEKGFGLSLLQSENSPSLDIDANRHAEWLGVSWEVDAMQSQAILRMIDADWLVVDHYALDDLWERQVSPLVGKVMAIDDLADRKHHVDVLLDQNLGRSNIDYEGLLPKYCIRLIGPHYALLRPEFSGARECSLRRRKKAGLGRILISMGGMDTPNTTSSILKSLQHSDLPSELNLDVIMGSAAPGLDEVRYLSEISRFNTSVSTDVRNMAERMCLADLSIGAAGSTSWERCVLGLPSIAVALAHNQSAILDALHSAGAAEKLGYPFDELDLIDAVNRFHKEPESLEAMTERASGVCDGKGVDRVLEWLNVKK